MTKTKTKPKLSPDDLLKLEANFAAAKRAIAEVQRGGTPSEVCSFCGHPMIVRAMHDDPPYTPYTTFVTGCDCGKSRGTFKGL
jgi:hypothetical protein